MSPTTIIDLDELLGEPKRVKLDGQVYELPPDLPVELYLKITRFAQTGASEAEMVEALYGEILELFRFKQPKLQALPLTLSQLVVAIGRIYGTDQEEEPDAVPPRRPRTSGGATRSGRSQRATRSR